MLTERRLGKFIAVWIVNTQRMRGAWAAPEGRDRTWFRCFRIASDLNSQPPAESSVWSNWLQNDAQFNLALGVAPRFRRGTRILWNCVSQVSRINRNEIMCEHATGIRALIGIFLLVVILTRRWNELLICFPRGKFNKNFSAIFSPPLRKRFRMRQLPLAIHCLRSGSCLFNFMLYWDLLLDGLQAIPPTCKLRFCRMKGKLRYFCNFQVWFAIFHTLQRNWSVFLQDWKN